MSNASSAIAGPSIRTRTIAYGGLAGSALAVLFGPQLAEWGLALLGCPLGYGAPGAGCGGVRAVVVGPLAALAGAAPPLETSIVLVHRLWPLLLVWGVAIVLSTRADRPLAEPAHADDQRAAGLGVAAATGLSAEQTRAQWVADREREQANDARVAQRSLRQQLGADTRFIGSIALTCWILICALLGFCLAFGLPLLGGVSAEIALDLFGCGPAHDSMMRACPGLEQRFEPYRQPFVGALLSPVWLFTQFGDVLLVWLAIIGLLAVLPLLRLGIRPVFRSYPVMSVTLIVITTLSVIAMAGGWLAQMDNPGGGFHEPVPAIAFIESVVALILSGVLALVLGLGALIMALALARRSRRATATKPHRLD